MLGLGEGGIGRRLIAEHQPERPVALVVVLPDLRRAFFDGVFEIGDRRQFLVFDLDQIGGIARLHLGLGDHEGDAVADIADLVVADQRQPGAKAGRRADFLRHRMGGQFAELVGLGVGAGQNQQHAGRGLGLRGVDALDPRVGIGRGHGHRIGLVRQVDVVDIAALAGEKTLVLDPLDRLPDTEFGHSVPRAD